MIDRYVGNIDGIELRHLRYFRAVAQELHFGRAAELLGMTQPPLSQQIRQLEERLGVLLFERTSRSVSLTAAGSTLLERSGAVFEALGDAVEGARRADAGEIGTVTISFATSVMLNALPSIVREFRDHAPDVRLELRELSTAEQVDGLRLGRIDVGFVREVDREPELELETVLREPLLIGVARSHPSADLEGPHALANFSGEPFVLFPREVAPGLHARILALCGEAGFRPRVVQESLEIATTVSLVAAGVGVTIVPASIRKLRWGSVRFLDVEEADAHTRIDMAYRARGRSPVVDAFLATVRARVQEGAGFGATEGERTTRP